jgi:hypothetical protein
MGTTTETINVTPEPAPAAMPAVVQPLDRGKATNQLIEQLSNVDPALVDRERLTVWLNSLVDAELARQNYSYDQAIARQYAISGYFEDIKGSTAEQSVAQAMVKIQLGRAWGFNSADAIRYIYFTNGRPAIENELIAAKLQQAGYEWDVEWIEETVQHKGKPWQKCVGCRLWLKKWNGAEKAYLPLVDRKGDQISVAFTEADADHAQIWEKGKQIPLSQKWNFQSWGRDMYYWRTISRVKKYHAPHVLRGAISREEAIEMVPASNLAPDELPRELPAAAPGEAQPEAHRASLREKVMSQPSFFPPAETAEPAQPNPNPPAEEKTK